MRKNKKGLAHRSTAEGFIALISTLILTIVLTMLLVATSTSTFFARFDSLGSEFKKVSSEFSEACVSAALLKIAQDYNYTPGAEGDVISVGTETCTIKSVTYGAEDPGTHRKSATLETHAKYPEQNGSWSTNKIEINIQNPAMPAASLPDPIISIESWK